MEPQGTCIILLIVMVLRDTGALTIVVSRKTVALGGEGATLRCEYRLAEGEQFQSFTWSGPQGDIFEAPHMNSDGTIFQNGAFLPQFSGRGSLLPEYRGQATTQLHISLSQINYSDEGLYRCTVRTTEGSEVTGSTTLIVDYSTSHSTIKCHTPRGFHLWCSMGTVQLYALEYGWNQNRNTCAFEPYGCTDGYRFPENKTHLEKYITKCTDRTVCYINPPPAKLKCYGYPVLISTSVAVRYWCADSTSKSITACHSDGAIPLWCDTGTVQVHEMRYGANQDQTMCTEQDKGSCVDKSYRLPRNRTHLAPYIKECSGRKICYLNPNPVRLQRKCFGIRGVISSFVTVYYSCTVDPDGTVVHNTGMVPLTTQQSPPPETVQTTVKTVAESIRATDGSSNTILIVVVACTGLIVGVLLTMMGEYVVQRYCCKTNNNGNELRQEKATASKHIQTYGNTLATIHGRSHGKTTAAKYIDDDDDDWVSQSDTYEYLDPKLTDDVLVVELTQPFSDKTWVKSKNGTRKQPESESLNNYVAI